MLTNAEKILDAVSDSVMAPVSQANFVSVQKALAECARADFVKLGRPADAIVWGAAYDMFEIYGRQGTAASRYFLHAAISALLRRLDNFDRRKPSRIDDDIHRPDESWVQPMPHLRN